MNRLNSKRTHISDEFNSINEYELKNKNNFNNINKNEEKFGINIYNNNFFKKTRNQNNIIIFNKKGNKINQNYEIDSMNEKMIESNSKVKDNYFKKNFNYYNNDSSERGLKRDRDVKKGIEEEIHEEQKKFFENLYDIMTGYNIEQKIIFDNLKLFFFNPIPDNKTLSTNINIRNIKFKNIKNKNKNIEKNKEQTISTYSYDLIENIKFYEFDLEILRNHQIYYFGKIIKTFPYIIIKIYISDNFTKSNVLEK